MSRTIGYRVPRSRRGETVDMCDYCGVQWYSGDLRTDASGQKACPDEGRGLDRVTLSEGNAEAAKAYANSRQYDSAGRKAGTGITTAGVDEGLSVQRTTRDDI